MGGVVGLAVSGRSGSEKAGARGGHRLLGRATGRSRHKTGFRSAASHGQCAFQHRTVYLPDGHPTHHAGPRCHSRRRIAWLISMRRRPAASAPGWMSSAGGVRPKCCEEALYDADQLPVLLVRGIGHEPDLGEGKHQALELVQALRLRRQVDLSVPDQVGPHLNGSGDLRAGTPRSAPETRPIPTLPIGREHGSPDLGAADMKRDQRPADRRHQSRGGADPAR